MHEQARREQARREAIAQRRAYEAYMRKEAARRRAAEEEAAAAEYRQAVMDRILKAYAAQAHAQQEEEEQEQVQATQSQSRIPISSFASDRGSEYEHEQDEASDEEEDEEPAQCHTPPLAFQNLEKELARDLPSNETKISYEEAVAIVQKHAQAALLIRRRLAALNKVRESFLAQQRAFRPPRT